MKILNIQKTTLPMPQVNNNNNIMLFEMISKYQTIKYNLNKKFCNKLIDEAGYSEWTATLNGERVTIIQAQGLIPVQVVIATL